MHRLGKPLHIWLLPSIPMFIAFFGKSRTVCEACCGWKSLHCAGGIGQKNQLAPCHASGRNQHTSLGRRRPRNLSSRRLANPDTMPIPPWRMLGLTTSQSSRSYLRQNTYARATNFTLGLTGRCDCSVPLLATPALCSFTNPERLTECLPYVRDPRRCRNMTMRPP